MQPRPAGFLVGGFLVAGFLVAGFVTPPLVAGCSGDDPEDESTPEEVLAAAKTELDETPGVELRLSTEALPDGIDGLVDALGQVDPAGASVYRAGGARLSKALSAVQKRANRVASEHKGATVFATDPVAANVRPRSRSSALPRAVARTRISTCRDTPHSTVCVARGARPPRSPARERATRADVGRQSVVLRPRVPAAGTRNAS